jgi:hypothetical protein
MRPRLKLAALGAFAILSLSPAPLAAQAAPQTERDPNTGTETQERLAEDQTNDFDWSLLGILGLAGLLDLRRRGAR